MSRPMAGWKRGDTGDSSDYPHQVDSGKTVPGIRQRLGRTRSFHYADATVEMTIWASGDSG